MVLEENLSLMESQCATPGTTKSHVTAPLQQMAVSHSLEMKGFTSVLGLTIISIVGKIVFNL